MSHTPYPPSYYAASANPAPARPVLQGAHETDVCVIGAGYTGMSTALFLLEQGLRVTVLEAAKVGFGASGRNGGQIVNSYSRDLDVVERQVGAQQAQLLGAMAFEGGRIIRELVQRYAIDCDLKHGGVFGAVNLPCIGTWTALGVSLRRGLALPRWGDYLGLVVGVLMLYAVVAIWVGGDSPIAPMPVP